MAYRRKQGLSRSSTFKEELQIHPPSSPSINDFFVNPSHPHPPPHLLFPSSPSSSSSSLAAKAIKATASRRDSSRSFAYADSAFAYDHLRSKGFDASNDNASASASGMQGDSKSGFWGVLAQKAKAMIDEDKLALQNEMFDRKMDNPTLRKGLDTITSSLNHLGDTFEKAFEEGRTIVESKTADLRTQIKRRGGGPEDSNQASWKQSPPTQDPNYHETQLKASRDVAMATAAKAKLLLRELKTVKADLAFAKARCAQLEEENKLLRDREGRETGHDGADDDLIRDQLETLLAEKARLANENETYSRENRFLREIVEYHQLTMQDVVYVDEGMEEVTEVYPMNSNGIPRTLSVSSSLSSSSSPPSPKASLSLANEIFPVPPESMRKSGAESDAPRISQSEDKPAK